MPSFSLTENTLRYNATDERALRAASRLASSMRDYDDKIAKQAREAVTLLNDLLSHVQERRRPSTPKPAKQPETTKDINR